MATNCISTFWMQITGIIKIIFLGQKIVQNPDENIDMGKTICKNHEKIR